MRDTYRLAARPGEPSRLTELIRRQLAEKVVGAPCLSHICRRGCSFACHEADGFDRHHHFTVQHSTSVNGSGRGGRCSRNTACPEARQGTAYWTSLLSEH